MMQASPCRHPPRLATWLVDLFASAEQAESILGDLAEEFSDIASTSGVLSARRWYWRESPKNDSSSLWRLIPQRSLVARQHRARRFPLTMAWCHPSRARDYGDS